MAHAHFSMSMRYWNRYDLDALNGYCKASLRDEITLTRYAKDATTCILHVLYIDRHLYDSTDGLLFASGPIPLASTNSLHAISSEPVRMPS